MNGIRAWWANVNWRKARRWAYGVLTAAVPLLMVYGVLDEQTAALWVSMGAAVFGTGLADGSRMMVRSCSGNRCATTSAT